MLGLFLHVSVTRRCQAAGLVSRENEQSRAAGAAFPPLLCCQCCTIHPLPLTVSLRSVLAWLPHRMGAPFLSLTLLKSLEAIIPECLLP